MALIPGMFLSFDDPLLGIVPNIIIFQYNPHTITRVFSPPVRGDAGDGIWATRASAQPAKESYSMTLEFDATDGLEREAPITSLLGIAPRLAALEMLLQPVRRSPLAALVGRLRSGGGTTIPASRVPLVIMVWGPGRIAPVWFDGLTITETGFDELLNPIHATADVSLTVTRPEDPARLDVFARAAAQYYQGAREVKALASLAQLVELA